LTQLVYCVTVTFTVTERVDQRIGIITPAHSTALVQAFSLEGGGGAKHRITQVCRPPLQPRFGSLRLPVFPKAKIVVESDEIVECDGHTALKLSQRRLKAD
jgi:hypothetical protein